MDCYLRRLKQELVRAGAGRAAPPRWAPGLHPGLGGASTCTVRRKTREGGEDTDPQAEGRACAPGKGPPGILRAMICDETSNRESERAR
jgi:hypothetical protein